MSSQIIEFYATDGVTLNGYINRGKVHTDKVLIEIHGMTSNCFKKREREISSEVEKYGIDTICFNTRGTEIVKYIKYNDGRKELAGTAYEDVEESYNDILGAIKYAFELGYNTIYLQGHSLGATKVVYTYSKMQKEESEFLKYIKGIVLLSLIDIPGMVDTHSDPKFIKYAEDKEKMNQLLDLMPAESFMHPISVKTFLKYVKYNEEIDFAQYSKKDDEFEILNKINIPLFIRWGDTNELIDLEAKELVEFMKKKIQNDKKDIGYIEGADHTYSEKEKQLAKEICSLLQRY